MSMEVVSPPTRTVARPASRPAGTTAASIVEDARTTRARVSPMYTSGSDDSSTTNPLPSMVTRPPSIAQRGRIPVTLVASDFRLETSCF
jgi:hypothetical protein